jgi:hypothetical protein
MKRGVVFSKAAAAAALCGLGMAGAAEAAHRHLASQAGEALRSNQAAETALASAIGGLAAFGDSERASLRARVDRFRDGLGGGDSWSRLSRQFGERWAAEARPRERKSAYSIQTGSFYLNKPSLGDWPSIVDAVGAAEVLPGVEILAVEMRSSGDRDRRSLDLVKVAVAIHAHLAADQP